jgi:hypothetical protein
MATDRHVALVDLGWKADTDGSPQSDANKADIRGHGLLLRKLMPESGYGALCSASLTTPLRFQISQTHLLKHSSCSAR